MHTHYPRLPGLARPTVPFFLQFVSIHLHFYAKLVVRDFYYCHEYIKKTINHRVTQSESVTHLSCLPAAMRLIAHTGRDGTRTRGRRTQNRPPQPQRHKVQPWSPNVFCDPLPLLFLNLKLCHAYS